MTKEIVSAYWNIVQACEAALDVARDHHRRMFAKHDNDAPELIEAKQEWADRERAVRDAWMIFRCAAEAQRSNRPFDYSFSVDLHTRKA
jgi:hypothetical protein